MTVVEAGEDFAPNIVTNVINDRLLSGLDAAQAVDFVKVEMKLRKRCDQVVKGIEGVVKKMNIPDYETKAPQDIKIRNVEQLSALEIEKESLNEAIAMITKFSQSTTAKQ